MEAVAVADRPGGSTLVFTHEPEVRGAAVGASPSEALGVAMVDMVVLDLAASVASRGLAAAEEDTTMGEAEASLVVISRIGQALTLLCPTSTTLVFLSKKARWGGNLQVAMVTTRRPMHTCMVLGKVLFSLCRRLILLLPLYLRPSQHREIRK